MFCSECGTQNPDTNSFCSNCGRPLVRPQQAPAPAPQPFSPPSATPSPANVPAPVPPAVPAAGKPPVNKGMLVLAILGLVAGLVSWIFYPYICGSAAVLFGGVAFFRGGPRKIVAAIAILAILTGLASMLVDNFYFVLFPPSEGTLLGFWLLLN